MTLAPSSGRRPNCRISPCRRANSSGCRRWMARGQGSGFHPFPGHFQADLLTVCEFSYPLPFFSVMQHQLEVFPFRRPSRDLLTCIGAAIPSTQHPRQEVERSTRIWQLDSQARNSALDRSVQLTHSYFISTTCFLRCALIKRSKDGLDIRD